MTTRLRERLRGLEWLAFAVHQYRTARRRLALKPQPTPHGFKFAGNRAMQSGAFEPLEVRLLGALIGAADRFVDVGANIGLYTCLARSLGKPAIAIEPLPDNLACLYANLLANGWQDTEVHAAGLAAHPGIATLYGTDTGASLVPGWANAKTYDFLRTTIPLTTLDNVIAERFAGERLAIKVDVEGVEYAMLQGARATLVREPRPVWLVEIVLAEQQQPDGSNRHFADTFEMFFEAGYEAFAASESARRVESDDVRRWVRQGHADAGAHNYVFRAPAERSHR